MAPKASKTLEQLVREINRDEQKLEQRLRALESLAAWVRADLYPWLLGLAAAAAYGAPLRRPPE